MRLNIHTILAKNFKRPNCLFLCWLVAYNHTFTFMYFFPEIVVVPQSLEQLKKETITNQALVCWHPRNLCLHLAREWPSAQAKFQNNDPVHAGSSLVFVNTDESWFVIVDFCKSFKLCETAKFSDKKYINVKVWLLATHQQKKRRFGLLKFWAIIVCIFKRIMGL